jgi:hypothetical protein
MDTRPLVPVAVASTVTMTIVGVLSLVGGRDQPAAADVPRGTSTVVEIDLPDPVVDLRDLPHVPLQLPTTVRDVVAWRLDWLGRGDDFDCIDVIYSGESSWRPHAIGDGGDSFGLPQRNAPAHGAPDWPWLIVDQVDWTVAYADDRYGGLCEAAQAWQERADARGGAGWW